MLDWIALLVGLWSPAATPAIPVAARECIVFLGPCTEFRSADAVLDATVDSTDTRQMVLRGATWPVQHARLLVHRAWKGGGQAIAVDVFSLWGIEDAVNLSLGRRYLLFAGRDEQGRLWVHGCGRTIPFARAAADIEFLESHSRPGSKSRLFGQVYGQGGPNQRGVQLIEVEIALKREGAPARRVRTSGFGAFAFDDLDIGVTYELSVVPPPGFSFLDPIDGRRAFVIGDARECVQQDLILARIPKIERR